MKLLTWTPLAFAAREAAATAERARCLIHRQHSSATDRQPPVTGQQETERTEARDNWLSILIIGGGRVRRAKGGSRRSIRGSSSGGGGGKIEGFVKIVRMGRCKSQYLSSGLHCSRAPASCLLLTAGGAFPQLLGA